MIPMMNHPMSKHWTQPDPKDWIFDAMHVLMSRVDFDALPEYSCSVPTGVYPGKMWKRREPYEDKAPFHTWFLLWYDVSEKGEKYCSIQRRKIMVV